MPRLWPIGIGSSRKAICWVDVFHCVFLCRVSLSGRIQWW